MLLVVPADHAGIGGSEHVDTPRSQASNEVEVHGVLIDVLAGVGVLSAAGCGEQTYVPTRPLLGLGLSGCLRGRSIG